MPRISHRIQITFVLIIYIFLFMTCSKLELDMEEKLVQESPVMHFLVINQMSNDIFLVPVDTSRNTDFVIIPDDTALVSFKAAVYEVIDKKDRSDTTQVIYHYRLNTFEETPFLFQSGDDYALRIKLNGESYTFTIEKLGGWYEDPPVRERLVVKVNGPPMMGMFVN